LQSFPCSKAIDVLGTVRPMRARYSRLIVLAVIAGTLLTACGSTTREAASQSEGDDVTETTTCPERSSFTFQRRVTNLLPHTIILSASDWICNDWSGVNTPGTAFNDLVIPAGESAIVTLEPAMRTTRNWTITVHKEGTFGNIGKISMTMPQTAFEFPGIQVAGATTEGFSSFTASRIDACDVLQLARTNYPDTPAEEWGRWYFTNDLVAFVVRDGYVTSLTQCIIHGA
jgi:hypothetical protein